MRLFLQQLARIEQIARSFQRLHANSTFLSLQVAGVVNASTVVQVVR